MFLHYQILDNTLMGLIKPWLRPCCGKPSKDTTSYIATSKRLTLDIKKILNNRSSICIELKMLS